MKKIVKILSVLIAAVMALSALGVTAFAESIEDTAKKISSGKSYSSKLNTWGETADYKIVVAKNGTLKINLTSKQYCTGIYVYDSNGNAVTHSSISFSSGNIYFEDREGVSVEWNKTVEKCIATITYKLQKGSYYIRFCCHNTGGSGELNFTATFPSSSSASSSAKISYLSIEIPKGTKMQLGAVVSAKTNSSIKWSTSKSSVVSVTSKGKITAKKKGTAIITAKLGSSTMKIKIKVK